MQGSGGGRGRRPPAAGRKCPAGPPPLPGLSAGPLPRIQVAPRSLLRPEPNGSGRFLWKDHSRIGGTEFETAMVYMVFRFLIHAFVDVVRFYHSEKKGQRPLGRPLRKNLPPVVWPHPDSLRSFALSLFDAYAVSARCGDGFKRPHSCVSLPRRCLRHRESLLLVSKELEIDF